MSESSNMHDEIMIMTGASSSSSAPVLEPGVDLISDLIDDLLLRILFFLPAASEVARTSVLSRRWRHLCPNASALRFTLSEADSDDEARCRRLIAAASAVVAQRATGGPDVEDVDLDFFVYASQCCGGKLELDRGRLHDMITSEHIAAWLLFAERRVTGRFMLAVPPPPPHQHVDDDDNGTAAAAAAAAASKLPCSARLEGLSLDLGEAKLTVPVTPNAGAFAALTNMLLSHVRLDSAAGDDVRLSGLLSSPCSPRLRRLELHHVLGLATLSLSAAAGTLEELYLSSLRGLTALDVAAPGLRELGVWDCGALSEARISAPRVQELHFVRHTRLLRFDGAASVRRIQALPMWSHRLWRRKDDDDDKEDYNDNSAAMWLLKNCTGVNRLCLDVMMPIWWSDMMAVHRDDIQEADIVDMIAEIPCLPNVIDLTITVETFGHAIGASLAKIIAKCTNMEHLSVGNECLDLSCICHHQSENWDTQKLCLGHLHCIEIRDMELLDSQIRLVRLLLKSATALERMTIGLDTSHLEDGEEVDFDDIPCYNGGRWVPSVWECSDLGLFVRPVEYEWMQDMETKVQGTGEALMTF